MQNVKQKMLAATAGEFTLASGAYKVAKCGTQYMLIFKGKRGLDYQIMETLQDVVDSAVMRIMQDTREKVYDELQEQKLNA